MLNYTSSKGKRLLCIQIWTYEMAEFMYGVGKVIMDVDHVKRRYDSGKLATTDVL